MHLKCVSDWIRDHALGVRPTHEDAVAAANAKMDPPGWRRACWARLYLGTLRYEICGRMPYDAVGSAIERLKAYQDDGNREHLVDAANLCRVEWLNPTHPRPCWRAQGDDGIHTQEIEHAADY